MIAGIFDHINNIVKTVDGSPQYQSYQTLKKEKRLMRERDNDRSRLSSRRIDRKEHWCRSG
jgi:hypothetical protein